MSVSIGLPYTDQGELLGLAIQSVLAQSFKDWELILMGDKPDDMTREVARRFTDSRIRFYENDSRIGLAATLNRITQLARHPLVARMDGDDIMHPNRIGLQKKAFDADPSIDVLGTRTYLIDEASNLVGLFKEPDVPSTGADYLKSNAFSHPTVMVKRKWLLENPYDESLLRGEDKELWLRTWSKSKFVKLPDTLMFYRRPRQMSSRRLRRDEAYNRHIMGMYQSYEDSAFSRVKRVVGSHLKEEILGTIGLCGLSPILFDTKWTALDSLEFSTAFQVLETIKRGDHVSPANPATATAATVTYGDRSELTERTVRAALKAGAGQIIVVDNGSTSTAKSNLEKLASTDSRMILVRLESNGGSAAGFAQAVSSFLQTTESKYLWLLDDDNESHPSTLRELIDAAEDLTSSMKGKPVGVCAIRPSNPSHAAIARGIPTERVYPPRGSFMYFDLQNRLSLLIARSGTKLQSTGHPIVDVPYAPYGGLLMSRDSLEIIGTPNSRLGLYEDDTEFTARFSRMGGRLVLCLTAIVNDLDAKWTESNGHTGLAGLLHATDSRRIFFAVRNRVSFDAKRSDEAGNSLRFAINRFVFRAAVKVMAVKYKKIDQGHQILNAEAVGLRGDFSRTFSDGRSASNGK